MFRISNKFLAIFIAYFVCSMAIIPWFINPFIVLENNKECMKHEKYTTEDANNIDFIYIYMILELVVFSSPYLFLLISVVICGCPIFFIVLCAVISNSIFSLIFATSIIAMVKNNLDKLINIPPICYSYIPEYAYDAWCTYRTFYILSILTIICCVATLIISLALFWLYVFEYRMLFEGEQYSLLENTTEQKVTYNTNITTQNEIEMATKN